MPNRAQYFVGWSDQRCAWAFPMGLALSHFLGGPVKKPPCIYYADGVCLSVTFRHHPIVSQFLLIFSTFSPNYFNFFPFFSTFPQFFQLFPHFFQLFPWYYKNHENQPTIKYHANPPGTMTNQPETKKNHKKKHENPPGTMNLLC